MRNKSWGYLAGGEVCEAKCACASLPLPHSRWVRMALSTRHTAFPDLITDFLPIASHGPGVPPLPLTAAESDLLSRCTGLRNSRRCRSSPSCRSSPPLLLEACASVPRGRGKGCALGPWEAMHYALWFLGLELLEIDIGVQQRAPKGSARFPLC
jgi:hypothetical protein